MDVVCCDAVQHKPRRRHKRAEGRGGATDQSQLPVAAILLATHEGRLRINGQGGLDGLWLLPLFLSYYYFQSNTMPTFAQALELAETWVRVIFGDECVIVKEDTLKRPYGWIFFYQSRAFLASGKVGDRLVGNAPILVDRVNGEIRITGTAQPLEAYLARYEAGLPPARMQMSMPKEP